MPIVTLISDWGLRDHYAAVIKGRLLSQCPDVTVVDISHQVPAFDIVRASFILRNTYAHFPAGTIHIVAIDSHAAGRPDHIALETDGHYFIGTDNGLFSLVFTKKPEKMVELTITQDSDMLTFPARDLFVKAACHLARGGTLELLGRPKTDMVEKAMPKPVTEKDMIRGNVIYVDDYGNVISNIGEKLFRDVGKGRPFIISFKRSGYDIGTLHKTYGDVPEGEMLALFGDSGFIEISINKGSAKQLLSMSMGDVVRVEFGK